MESQREYRTVDSLILDLQLVVEKIEFLCYPGWYFAIGALGYQHNVQGLKVQIWNSVPLLGPSIQGVVGKITYFSEPVSPIRK